MRAQAFRILHDVFADLAVKYIPEWFPGATFQKKARQWRVSVTGMMEKPYEAAKSIYVSVRLARGEDILTFFLPHCQDKGNHAPSFMASWLDRLSLKAGESDRASVEVVVKNVGATAFLGGVETVSFAIKRRSISQNKADNIISPHLYPRHDTQSRGAI